MIAMRRSACARHRPLLEAFVERREPAPGSEAALAHLDRCRSCRAAVTELALTVIAIDHVRADADRLAGADGPPPPIESWHRLRARIERGRPQAWRWRSQVAGMFVGAGLVAALMGPLSGSRIAQPALDEAGPSQAWAGDQIAEQAWIRSSSTARKEWPSVDLSVFERYDPAAYGEGMRRAVSTGPARLPSVTAR